jgi:hypothetical protein
MTNVGSASVHQKCSYGCGYQTTTHSYTKTTQTAATCTAKGTSKYTCSCGYNYTSQDIAALGHNYQTQTAATCTAAEVEKCSRCSSTRTGDPALGHNIVNGGTAAVHTKCGRCGITLSSTHSYTKTTQTAATCTVKGTSKYTCSCGYSYTSQDIAALGHNYGSYSAYTSTTHRAYCQNSGCSDYKSGSCSFTYKTGVVATSGNCTTAPTYYYECSTCTNRDGSTYAGTAPGHNYQTYTAATCTSAEVEKCSRCGGTRTGDAATGHSYGYYSAYTSTTHRRTCSKCSASQTANCSFTYRTGDEATPGSCTVAPTYFYECSTCTNRNGTTYAGTAPGHNYVETVAPTCTSSGKMKCSRCSASYSIAAPGHDVEYGGVASQHTYCATCGITLSTTHSYSITTTATCKTSGIKTCSCGYSISYSNTSNHTGPITTTDSSTCTKAGTITQKCTGCNRTVAMTAGDALGHSYTSSGTCSRCGAACSHSYKTTYIPATGNKHRVIKTCTICNSSSTTLQGCVGHLLVDDKVAQCVCGNEVARLN